MPGRVKDREAVTPHLQDLSLFQKAIGLHAECSGIETVNQNRGLCYSFQLRNTTHVVDMAMGDRDIRYGEAGSGYFFDDAKHFISRVDNQSLVRLLASQDIAVGLIRTDNEFSKHFSDLLTISPTPLSPLLQRRTSRQGRGDKTLRRDFVKHFRKNKGEEVLVKRWAMDTS